MIPIRDHNPSQRTPVVVYALIALNVAIWVWGALAITTEADLARLYYHYALVPALVTEGLGWTGFLTSIFLHGGPLHLAGNMLFLWIFGDNLEDRMGHLRFALFYLACGLAGGAAQVLSEPFSAVPTIGASGAIAGVMGGYLLLFPKARVDVFLYVALVSIPAFVVLAVWFALQLLGGLSPTDGVAYWAHNGGFIAGVLLILPLWLRLGGPRFWRRTHGHPPHPPPLPRRSSVPSVPRRR